MTEIQLGNSREIGDFTIKVFLKNVQVETIKESASRLAYVMDVIEKVLEIDDVLENLTVE